MLWSFQDSNPGDKLTSQKPEEKHKRWSVLGGFYADFIGFYGDIMGLGIYLYIHICVCDLHEGAVGVTKVFLYKHLNIAIFCLHRVAKGGQNRSKQVKLAM